MSETTTKSAGVAHETPGLDVDVEEMMTLSMGPNHPSTHGVLRLIVTSDGEVVHKAKPDLGYLHRSIEKIGEFLPYYQFVPYTDRVDYVCAMNSNYAYCLAVEKLCDIDIPERARYIRLIFAELNRISSHMICVGALAMDMGAFTPFLHALVEREKVNDIFEDTCGNRLTYNYYTLGGVMFDVLPDFNEKVLTFCDEIDRRMHEFNKLITFNEIFVNRLEGVGVVSPEEAVSYGLVGPNMRGSGIDWDLRRDEPYGAYDRLKDHLDIPVANCPSYTPIGEGDSRGVLGDAWKRFWVRLEEVFQSSRLIRRAVKEMPDGPVQGKVPKVLRPPKGAVYVRSENPRGETGYYLVSDGTPNPMRIKIRTGSFTAMSIFEHLSRGLLIGDLVAIIGSFDIVIPEVDR